MNEIEEAVLETVSEKYLTPKASDTGPLIGILHRNRKGAAIISPLTARTTVRSATSRMTDGIRLGFARLFADDSRAPADASNATKTAGSDSRSPRVRLDAPPIANADGEPHYEQHEDDVDSPTIAGIRRAETSVRNDKRRAPKSPATDDDAAPSAKGVFFRDFPVSIEPLPSQKRGAALSSANKCSPSGKARSGDPLAGSGGHAGGGGGGSGGGGDDPPDAGSRADDDEEESMDDDWDTFDRSAFGYDRHHPDDIRAKHARRQPSLEPDWKEIQLNRDDIIYDAATNQVFQWRAYHPINGLIDCFSARIGMKYINEELFVASLHTGHFDSTNQKLFERRFLSYGHGDPLLTYLSCVVKHALQYKFFIPPLQKLRPGRLLISCEQGALPPWVRLAAVSTMPGILANCLWSKTANLYCDSSYGAIVWANENGYETFRQLALLAGHPSLSPCAITRDPPKQRADCDVARHLEDWK
jgi:hypothetical protein